MNLSRKWLQEFVDITVSDQEYNDVMTLAGQKVERIKRMDADLRGVIVGRVLSITRHEDSDHMWVCQVEVSADEILQIVTGAQNVKAGDLVPVAQHNSTLPGGVHIKKGKLRGILSCGMLCSFSELGLTPNDVPDACDDGIWILNDEDAVVGQDLNTLIGNDDSIVEFEITNNRSDCYSLIGLARETAAAFGIPMKHHTPCVKGGASGELLEMLNVEVPADDLCARYTARIVRNVKIAPSPKWMRQRLRAAGIRPINNIVDITNYVMVEYGQPMHAFDYRYVRGGKIVVRRAENGEMLKTLDGVQHTLTDSMLVIADEEQAVGLAGVMGGENSEIMADTRDVVFESANFSGTSIRQTALALGMRTEASAKFEKKIDPFMTLPAVNRACELLEMLSAGEVLDGVIDVVNDIPEAVSLPLEPEKINRLLGTDISAEEMKQYLTRLEIPVEGMTIRVPSFRPDLRCMADIAEEVGRLYGYNRMPTTMIRGAAHRGGYSDAQKLEGTVSTAARNLGFDEILTYSFVSPAGFDQIRLSADSPLRGALKIQNPLGEDTSVMRTTALPSMLETLARNNNYHNKAVKLYELATIYFPMPGETLPREPKRLVLGSYGFGEDFFRLKGEVEVLLRQMRVKTPTCEAITDNPSYHPGRCAALMVDGTCYGVFGQIHPLVAKNYGIDGEIYAAELFFTELSNIRLPEATFMPIPKFPAVMRDLAIVCEDDISVGALSDCIRKAGGGLLRQVKLFDIYRGAPIASGQKSVAFSLQLRSDDRTLTDEESDRVISAILDGLKLEFNAQLR